MISDLAKQKNVEKSDDVAYLSLISEEKCDRRENPRKSDPFLCFTDFPSIIRVFLRVALLARRNASTTPSPSFTILMSLSTPASSSTSIVVPIAARNLRLERGLFLELVVDGLELRLLLRLGGGFDEFGEEEGFGMSSFGAKEEKPRPCLNLAALSPLRVSSS